VTTLSQRLEELGLALPEPVPVRGRFRSVVVRDGIAYVSGAIATTGPPLAVAYPGTVDIGVSLDDAKESARGAMLAVLAAVADAVGVDAIDAVLHLGGYVRVAPGFDDVHMVVGAATALVGDLFGDDALPARTAVGVASLPAGASVLLDAVVAVKP
jgi:enamine deaminase RidA (YjgF/YER057c/UK114 family)